MLEQLYLPQCSLRQNFLAEDIGDLLDGNTLLSLGIGRRTVIRASVSRYRKGVHHNTESSIPNNTISSLAKLLGHSVSLIHNEVLVEHLEDLPSLEIRHGAGE